MRCSLFGFGISQGIHEDKWILDDLSFQVAEGEVLGIVGPNGSGKTSLLKLLARLVSPQQGTRGLFGQDLTGMGQDDGSCGGSGTTRYAAALSLYGCGNSLNGTISSSSSRSMGNRIWMGKA
ncbi:MAG: ATP-binding cassette domain-containing protein [Nitrospira sp.]